ncbi:hypothetical protein GCM10010970_38870 [Silvimonas iriomotensis]|uniref:Uncharacterized protein n=2 Tax=Silvimonas iriomotensis TaxID=449662 RepID=A0ABQ2PF49_9NEIS|nr:hypothetical protein GCM10010970_38870 [Silvimonas iriomotensis]
MGLSGLAGLGLLTLSASAWADPLVMTCTGAASFTYNPGLTNTTQSIQFTSNQTDACVPVLGAPTGLTGGTHSFSSTLPLSCDELLGNDAVSVVRTYYWNDPAHSQSQVTYPSVRTEKVQGNSVITFTGTVTGGLGLGSAVTQVIVLVNTALLQDSCASAQGIQSVSGAVSLTFGL